MVDRRRPSCVLRNDGVDMFPNVQLSGDTACTSERQPLAPEASVLFY